MATGRWPGFDIVVDNNNIPMGGFVNHWPGYDEIETYAGKRESLLDWDQSANRAFHTSPGGNAPGFHPIDFSVA